MSKFSFSLPLYKKNYKEALKTLIPFRGESLTDTDLQIKIASTLSNNLKGVFDRVSFRRFLLSAFTREEWVLSKENIRRLAKISSGTAPWISLGDDYPAWKGSPGESTAIFIDTVEKHIEGNRLYQCILDAEGGLPAGQSWSLLLPGGLLQSIIRECGGYKYKHHSDIDAGGMRFTADIYLKGGKLMFKEVRTSSSQFTFNRELFKERDKVCVRGLYDRDCFNCPSGRDICRLSRHGRTYPKGVCSNSSPPMNKHKGYIVSRGLCLHCITRNLVKKRKP